MRAAIAILALAACHRHAISEDQERITVTVDAARDDATVDALNAELRELAAPSGPGAPPAFGFRIGPRVEAMSVLRAREIDLAIYLRALRELSRRHAELTFTIAFDPETLSFAMRGGSCGDWGDAFDRFVERLNVPPAPAPRYEDEDPPDKPVSAQLPGIAEWLGDKALVTWNYMIEPSGAVHEIEHDWVTDRDLMPAAGLLRDVMTDVALPAAPPDHAVTRFAYASTGEAILHERWIEAPGRNVSQLRLVARDGAIRSSPRIIDVSDLHITRDRTQLVHRRIRDGHPELVRLELASLSSQVIAAPRAYDAYALDEDGQVVAFVGADRRIVELADRGEPRELARIPRGVEWSLIATDRLAVWLANSRPYRAPTGEYRRTRELVRIDRKAREQRTAFTWEQTYDGPQLAKFDGGWYVVVEGAVSLIDDDGVHPVVPADPGLRAHVAIAAAPDGLLAVVGGAYEASTLTLYRGTRLLFGPTQIPPTSFLSFRNATH